MLVVQTAAEPQSEGRMLLLTINCIWNNKKAAQQRRRCEEQSLSSRGVVSMQKVRLQVDCLFLNCSCTQVGTPMTNQLYSDDRVLDEDAPNSSPSKKARTEVRAEFQASLRLRLQSFKPTGPELWPRCP